MSIGSLGGRDERAIGIVALLWLEFNYGICYEIWEWWCVECGLVSCGRIYEFIPFFTFVDKCVVWGRWGIMEVVLWNL